MKKTLLLAAFIGVCGMAASAAAAVAATVVDRLGSVASTAVSGARSACHAAGEVIHRQVTSYMASYGLVLYMTTLAVNKPRAYDIGARNMLPVIASDIIYEGSAVGIVAATGHSRPLVAGDAFGGFAVYKADNSTGSAADINVEVIEKGQIELTVTGAVATDLKMPVYATDDDTFTLSPVGGSFIGFVKRFVSTGVVVVDFDSVAYRDPWAAHTVRETLSANKTLDAEDTGKLFWVDTDAFTITLPAIATGLDGCVVVNGGAFGAVAVTLSPDANDMILGPDITGANDKDLINTKATARRGDFVKLGGNDADGYAVLELRGTWARQA